MQVLVGAMMPHYQYNAETYENYGIYLRRPTQLNKGFDFTVNVQRMYFKKNRRYSSPSHQDIFDALTCCMDEYPEEYGAVWEAILDIYNCIDIDLSHINAYFRDYEGTEHPIQIILLAINGCLWNKIVLIGIIPVAECFLTDFP